MERISIPKGVEEIQAAAFSYCYHLDEMVFESGSIPKGIDHYMFYYGNYPRMIMRSD